MELAKLRMVRMITRMVRLTLNLGARDDSGFLVGPLIRLTVVLLSLMRLTAFGDTVDFNSGNTFDSSFFSTTVPTDSTLTNGVGLSGSRGVSYGGSVSGHTSDLRIYSPVVFHPDTPVWSVSIYFQNPDPSSLALPMVGFIGQDDRYGMFYYPDLTVPTIYTTVQSNGLSLTFNNNTYLDSANILPAYSASSWYQLSLQMVFVGTVLPGLNQYDIQASLIASDSSGMLGETVATIDHTLTTTLFQTEPDLYGFFGIDTPNYAGWTGPGFTGTMDNLVVAPAPLVAAPEPSSDLLLAAGACLSLVSFRRRRGSSRQIVEPLQS